MTQDLSSLRSLTCLASMALHDGDIVTAARILAQAQARASAIAVVTARTNDPIEYVVGWSDRKGKFGKTPITSTSPYLAAMEWLDSQEASELPDGSIAACDTPDNMDTIANTDDPDMPCINLCKEFGTWLEIDVVC